MIIEKKPKSLLRNTKSIGLATLLSRLLGLGRDALIAGTFGAGFFTDAFYAAFKIPNFLRKIVAEGTLGSIFVPIFLGELHKGEDDARKAVRAISIFTVTVTTIISIIGIIFSGDFLSVFVHGWESDEKKLALAAALLKIMFPYVIIVSLLSLATSVLNSLKLFLVPALAQAIFNFTLIISIFYNISSDITELAWAVLAAGLLSLLPQLYLLRRVGFGLSLLPPFGFSVIGQVGKLIAPALLGASLYQVMVLLNVYFASFLPEGSVSWLYYADRVFQFPIGIFSLALAQALLPSLSAYASAKDEVNFSKELSHSLNLVCFITLPASAGLFILAEPIIDVIYHRGSFDAHDLSQTALALKCYSIGLWFISSQSLITRAFIAHKNTLTPALVSILGVAANIAFILLFSGSRIGGSFAVFPGVGFDFSHEGLALSTSLSSALVFVVYFLILGRIAPFFSWKSFSLKFLKSALAVIGMAFVVKAVMLWAFPAPTMLLLAISLGIGSYFLMSFFLKQDELREILDIFFSGPEKK